MSNNTGNIISADDLRPLYKYLSKNWFLLLLFPLIGFIIASIATHRLPDIYAAKTEILLKSDETYNYQNELRSNFGYFSQYADIENQKRIIKSYDLIDQAISKLNFNIGHFIKGRLKTEKTDKFEAFNISADISKCRGVFSLPIRFDILNLSQIEVSYDYEGDTRTFTQELGEPLSDPLLSGITISASKKLDLEMIDTYKESSYSIEIYPKSAVIAEFRNALVVQNVDYTSILTMQVSHEVKEHAKEFLDTLSGVYLDYSLQKQYRVNENTQVYIEKQLQELEQIMDSLEFSIEIYKNSKNIIDLDKEQNYMFQTLLNYEERKANLERVRDSFDDLLEFVLEDNNNGELPPSFYVYNEDQLLSQQVIELYEMRKERLELLNDFTESTVTVQRQDSTINIQTRHIETYISNSRKAVEEDIRDQTREINKITAQLFNVPKAQRALLEVERKLKVNETLYVYLLESRASTVIAKAAILPEISIIENARSLGKIGPNSSRTIYLAIGISLFIAGLIGLARFILFERIETVSELKSISKVPVLGSIPYYSDIQDQPIAILENSRSNISESFRALRTNLQYLMSKEGGNVILISSLHPSEGKTFVSTNLSSMIAKAGKRTLLIDFDLHKPKVHKTFGLNNTRGTSSIISKREHFESCITHSQLENLDIITAGPVPPNASELILNESTEELLAQLKSTYDFVIIDTPPLMLISDSLVLHKHADNTIFVLNTEKANKGGINFLEETLKQNEITNVSLILNNIKLKRWQKVYAKYGYKYGYSYSYGYGYGYGYGGYGSYYGNEKDKGKRNKNKKRNSK